MNFMLYKERFMFIFYSTQTTNETYIVDSSSNACKKCGTQEKLILTKTNMLYKLFWLIPIFNYTYFSLHCPVCGKKIKISKDEGKALMELSLYQNYQNKKSDNPFEDMNNHS